MQLSDTPMTTMVMMVMVMIGDAHDDADDDDAHDDSDDDESFGRPFFCN